MNGTDAEAVRLRSLLGMDYGDGKVSPISDADLRETVVVRAGNAANSGSTYFDIWHPHPMLTVYCSLHRRPASDQRGSNDPGRDVRANLTATLEAWNIVKSGGTVRETSQISSQALFVNAGVLSSTSDDGFELSSGTEGVRIKIAATRTTPGDTTPAEIVAKIYALQNQPFGCIDLATACFRRLVIEFRPVLDFPYEYVG